MKRRPRAAEGEDHEFTVGKEFYIDFTPADAG